MRQFVAVILFFICCLSYVNAQTFLDRLRHVDKGAGIVTVTQSKTIDELVNGKKYRPEIKHRNDSTEVKNDKKVVATVPDSTRQHSNDSTQTIKTTGPRRRVIGYRVQAFAGNNSRVSRDRARQIGERLKSEFPGHSVYVHFYTPRWVCRMGNYQTREEAEVMLRKVKDLGYNAACLVKGKITVY